MTPEPPESEFERRIRLAATLPLDDDDWQRLRESVQTWGASKGLSERSIDGVYQRVRARIEAGAP